MTRTKTPLLVLAAQQLQLTPLQRLTLAAVIKVMMTRKMLHCCLPPADAGLDDTDLDFMVIQL